MSTVTEHRARTKKPCSFYWRKHVIAPGQRYRRHVAFPGDEGHEEGVTPWVLNECDTCILESDDRGYWVRRQYQVPAHVDSRITFQGEPATIWGFGSSGLLIVVDGTKHPVPVHPTWKIEYDRAFDPVVDTPHDVAGDADDTERKEKTHVLVGG